MPRSSAFPTNKVTRKAQLRAGRAPIMEAAIDNFQRFGYHGTSIRDIARDADITVASIYHHFSSKQQILHEIMRTVLMDAIEATRRAIENAAEDPLAELDALIRAWVVFHCMHKREALIGASEIRSLDETGRPMVIALRDEQEEIFRQVIDHGLAEDALTIAYPREAVRAMIAMGASIATWYRSGNGLTPDELADRYGALARGMVGARDV